MKRTHNSLLRFFRQNDENGINLDILNNNNPLAEIKQRIKDFVSRFDGRKNNFNHFLVIISALVGSYL